jgi:hypothetical protein
MHMLAVLQHCSRIYRQALQKIAVGDTHGLAPAEFADYALIRANTLLRSLARDEEPV